MIECKHSKLSVRNACRDTILELMKLTKEELSDDTGKDAEVMVQNLTDAFGKKIDDLYSVKEKDIITISSFAPQ